MTKTNTKRWAVLRKTTGKMVRAFDSREGARGYKRYTNGSFTLFDTQNNVAIR